jgi:C-terminal peptidase (prc)
MNTKNGLPILLVVMLGVFVSFKLIAVKPYEQAYTDDVHIEPFSAPASANLSRNVAIQQTIYQVIRDGHFSPRDINDDFSKKAFAKYMEFTDFGKVFFLQDDIDAFKKYESQIDDEIKNGTTELFNKVFPTLQDRINESEQYYKTALEHPFSFEAEEEIELDGKKLTWAKNKEELKNRWAKSMKYRTLVRYNELKEEQAKSKNEKEKKKTNQQLEEEARKSVLKNMENYFKRLRKLGESDRFAQYINSICHVVDPHTDFLPPKDKQRFDEEMSGSFFGIGAQLRDEEGKCKVVQIIVGSPCWKDGRLKVNDIIQKVAQGAEEPVDVDGWDLEDIVQLIRGKQGSEVRLTVKHINGSIEVINLIRGKVETESTFAKSAIIKSNGLNIGYILLPEFYANFNEANGRRCAVDVEKEINKLKQQNIDGLIFDVRNNGGGSLSDVVEICGMFIDRGPVVQVKSKEAPAQPLYDRYAGTLYDGPLVIMVNHASASASEILAAAMQDYNRGIVMGSTTFGKGTVQRVFPLEEFYRGDPKLLPFGSIKLTLQKFYRINGGSTQLKGVTPHINLPDLYQHLDFGERKDENSLPWDQIAKAEYKTIKDQVDFEKLIELSKKRTSSNETFALISKNALRLKQQNDDNRYSLQEKKFQAQIKESKDFSKKMEELDNSKTNITATNLKADLERIKLDTVLVRRNDEWIKAMNKDVYIAEAGNVINDWVKMLKANTGSSGIKK